MSVHAQEKFSQVVTDSERWDTIAFESTDECAGSPDECAVKMLTGLNIGVGESPEFSVYRLGQEGEKMVTVVFVSHFVDDDDLLLGRLYRLKLSRNMAEDNSFRLEQLGRLSQCMNGPSGWRKTQCPE